jgi:hypothetical protein
MVEFSFLRFVCFLIPLCFRAFPGAINFCISGFFFKRLNILYIYGTLIFKADPSHSIPVLLINYYCLKKT